MSKCNHEKVCVECVKAEIVTLKERIKELESKLPQTIYINVPYSPFQPIYTPSCTQPIYCTGTNVTYTSC